MFDIGFSELLVIAVVALIVIGPERLPKTARTLGHLFGRLQRYVNDVKADINREMELEELRKLQAQMQGAAKEIEQSVTSAASELSTGARSVEEELNRAVTDSPASPPSTPPPAEPTMAAAPTPDVAAGAHEPPRQPNLPGFEKI